MLVLLSYSLNLEIKSLSLSNSSSLHLANIGSPCFSSDAELTRLFNSYFPVLYVRDFGKAWEQDSISSFAVAAAKPQEPTLENFPTVKP